MLATRINYNQELEELTDDVKNMGIYLERVLTKVIENLKAEDKVLARHVMGNDDKFDRCERQIEQKCFDLVVKQAPIAGDWRRIASILKMVSDIERMGDHCQDLSQYTLLLAELPSVELPPYFTEMVDVMQLMVHNSISCFIQSDTKLANQVIAMDDTVDDFFIRWREDLIKLMEAHPEHIAQYVYYLMIGKYIERIADHTTNISEWIIYTVTSELK